MTMKLSNPDLIAAVREVGGNAGQDNGGNGRDLDGSEIIQLEISRLAKLGLLQYDHERPAAAQRLGVRAPILDRLVEQERKKSGEDNKQGQAFRLPEPEPWPEPLDGAALFGARRRRVRPSAAGSRPPRPAGGVIHDGGIL
jgi:hypothetical protein